jgi:hypothetical protein
MSASDGDSRAAKLAKTILADLRGSTYYGDPRELAPMIRTGTAVTQEDQLGAVEIIRSLLRLYANGAPPDEVEAHLARNLEARGIR